MRWEGIMTSRDKVIVCDNGTGFVKCGFAGDDFPRATFPAMVGRPTLRFEEGSSSVNLKSIMCGDECAENRHALDISYPVSNAIIKDYPDMIHLWDYTFHDKLGIPKQRGALNDYKILLTEPPLNPTDNRKKMLETMFENYGFGGVSVQIQAVLTLYGQGIITGVVVDSGDGVTHMVPVFEAHCLTHNIRRMNLAGHDITEYLIKLLFLRGYTFNRTADFDTVRQIKEALCYVGVNLDLEKKLALETTVLDEQFELPDGTKIIVGRERFEASEAIFRPQLVDKEGLGMSEMLFDVINSCPMDLRPKFYRHIVLSGGTTMLAGLPSRLEQDLKSLYCKHILDGKSDKLKNFKLKIEDPPMRKTLVFTGGAIFADLMRTREDAWISRQEWQEGFSERMFEKLGSVTN